MSKSPNNAEVSTEIQQKAGSLLNRPRTTLSRVFESKTLREQRTELTEIVKEEAVAVRQAQLAEAASICKLNGDFHFQMAMDKAVSEHVDQMNRKRVNNEEVMASKLISILEEKNRMMNTVAKMSGDEDLLAEAMQHIESIHINAAQGTINRNIDS